MFEVRYTPTPEQIAAECESIRAGWTPTQLLKRTVTKPRPFEFQTIPIRAAIKRPNRTSIF